MRTFRLLSVPALLFLTVGAAQACPVCESDTARQVRAGLFDSRFMTNLAVTVLPFTLLTGIVAVTYYGPPAGWRRQAEEIAE